MGNSSPKTVGIEAGCVHLLPKNCLFLCFLSTDSAAHGGQPGTVAIMRRPHCGWDVAALIETANFVSPRMALMPGHMRRVHLGRHQSMSPTILATR